MEKSPWDSASTPRPWQRLQTSGEVPGLAPVPRQVAQGADSGTLTGTCAPAIAWSKEMCTSVSRSRPGSGRSPPPGPPLAFPRMSERMSPKPPKPPRNEPGSKPVPNTLPPAS